MHFELANAVALISVLIIMHVSIMLLIFLWPLSWSKSYLNSKLSLIQLFTVAEVQEKYIKDDDNIDDNEWWGKVNNWERKWHLGELFYFLHSLLNCFHFMLCGLWNHDETLLIARDSRCRYCTGLLLRHSLDFWSL